MALSTSGAKPCPATSEINTITTNVGRADTADLPAQYKPQWQAAQNEFEERLFRHQHRLPIDGEYPVHLSPPVNAGHFAALLQR